MEMGILSMKQIKNIYLIVFAFFEAFLIYTPFTSANAVSCNAGSYPYLSWCHGCIEGCYCTGPGIYQGAGYLQRCDTENKQIRFGAITHSSGWNNVYTCPKDYKFSKPGAKSDADCFAECGGNPVYYKKKSCKSGEYRPKGTNDCKSCPDDGKSYCTGVSNFYPTCDGAGSDQGKSTCDINNGKVPNSTRTGCLDKQCGAGEELKGGKCVKSKINCIAGTYLPANSESCAACPSGKLCLGGDFDKQPIDQGDDGKCDSDSIINSKGSACIKCEAGTAPNATQTACTEAAIHVEPGYYLPANKVTPTKCSGARKYCPGGDYKKGITDVGIFECPFSGRANADGTACNVTISKEQMQYGPVGKNAPLESQCWLRTDPDDYRTCIFGTRFDVSTD